MKRQEDNEEKYLKSYRDRILKNKIESDKRYMEKYESIKKIFDRVEILEIPQIIVEGIVGQIYPYSNELFNFYRYTKNDDLVSETAGCIRSVEDLGQYLTYTSPEKRPYYINYYNHKENNYFKHPENITN